MTASDSPPPLGARFVDQPGADAPIADDPISEAAARSTPSASARSSMIRSGLVVSSMTMLSRLMGFARDQVIAYTLGASVGYAADAYATAQLFPNLFRRIFAEGAFAAAFVPAYAKSLARDGEEVADVLAADAMAVLTAATVGLTLVAELTMTWLMYVISPGYTHIPGKFQLAVWLTRITMPYLPCMAIYAHLSGVLNARGRFLFAAFAPTLLNLVMLIAVLPQKNAQAAAFAASWAVLVAGVMQAGLLWWGVRRSGGHVDFRWPRLTPDITALVALAIPGALAASATQINIVVSNVLVSHVNGARSWLGYADRLYQLPLGMIGVAMGVALLPRLSQAVQAEDRLAAQGAMDEAIGFSMALTLPAAAALIAMPFFLIDGLFTRGEFHAVDAHNTARALFHYGWGVPAFVLQQLFSRAFFARGDTKTPMRFAVVSVGVNILLGVTLFQLVGFEGIAAATAAASWVNVAMMAATLRRRGAYNPSRATLVRIAKLLLASALMAVLLWKAAEYRSAIQHVLGRKEVALAVTTLWGGVIYVGLLLTLQAVTPAEVRGALKRSPRKGRQEGAPPAAKLS